MTGIRCVWKAGALLGEGPAWCREEGAPYRGDRVCVTSATLDMAPERRAEAPLPGGSFEIDAGVAGLPGPGFAG